MTFGGAPKYSAAENETETGSHRLCGTGITTENWGILFRVLSAFSANCLAWKFPYRNASTRDVCTPEFMEMACAISVLRRIRSTIHTARCRSNSVRCSCMIVKMGCIPSARFSTCTSSPTPKKPKCHVQVHQRYQKTSASRKAPACAFFSYADLI